MRNVNPLQALVDAHSAQEREKRSREQLTLGQAIAFLETLPADMKVDGLGALGSYRGYYSDLAFGSDGRRTMDARGLCEDWDSDFNPIPDTKAPDSAVVEPGAIDTVADLLADCRSALGACFEGYKGGNFWMTAATPLWVSSYGSASGMKVTNLDVVDGVLRAATEQEEW